MNEYAAVLLWAIPGFLILVIFEIIYGHLTKNNPMFLWILSLALVRE